jgi:hypothetical protein
MKQKNLSKKICSFFITAIFFSPSVWAFAPIGETGEILKGNEYQAGLQPSLITSQNGGPHMNVFFDAPINESTCWRALIGSGAIDFVGSLSIKYVPFPDIGNQPAMGLRAGILVARPKDEGNVLAFEFTPLFSKKMEAIEEGVFTPYVGLPLRIVSGKNNYYSTQMAFGTDWHPTEIQDYFFNGEIGINLKDSYSYLAFGVTLPFDKSKGLQRRD